MNQLLRYLFFLLVIRPIVLVVLGLNVRRAQLIPKEGPAIIVANHNSHLDAIVLMTLFGMKRLHKVHPVAAADYFLKTPRRAWFSTQIIGILPLERKVAGMRTDPLAGICEGLERNEILILFPEGSRGEPEQMAKLQNGIAHVAKRRPDVPIVPVFMHGLGKAMPRGEGILVPFFVDIFVGEKVDWSGNRDEFISSLETRFEELSEECYRPEWD